MDQEFLIRKMEKYADRKGGYTRVTKTGIRKGDNAPLATIELL